MWSLYSALVLINCTSVLAQDFSNPQTYINQLKLSDNNFRDAFNAINVEENNNLITEKDLEIFYHHQAAGFAKDKFLRMVDTNPGGVTIKELATFMQNDPVKLAVHECIYIRSQSLRRFCLGDKILTYVYLVLDQQTVDNLFKALNSLIKDNKLDNAEIKALQKYDAKFNDEAVNYFIKEIGQGNDHIDEQAFSKYVKREDLNSDFRGCKNDETNTSAYDENCLIKALMHYTMYDVTEYMTALMFSALNKKVEDFALSESDMADSFGADQESLKHINRFFEIIDYSKDETVTYGEFRAYIHSHSVKLHLERACLRGENVEAWDKNRECLKWAMWDLIKQNHRPMMMTVSDLEMVFLFEQLDKNNNGKIEVEEDLVQRVNWKKSKAEKFVHEIGSDDSNNAQFGYVTLDDFNNYVDEPNMVFCLAGCLTQDAGNSRLTCYAEKLDKIITSILNKTQVKDFIRFYDKSDKTEITRVKLEAVHMQDNDEIDNFIRVLGMGDEIITQWEFTWFVKQKELSERFNSDDMKNDQLKLHNELREYLKDIMTEYDIQLLFRKLDTNNNFELDRYDFENIDEAQVLKNMKLLDGSGKVSFLEFWLFLNTPSKDDNKLLRKRKLENECTKGFQFKKDLQVDCYQRTIKNVH